MRKRRVACVALALACAAGAPACRSRPRNFANENDRLRREVAELRERTLALEAARDELRAKLGEHARHDPLPPDVLDALPRCAGIEIDRLSGILARPAPGSDGAGRAEPANDPPASIDVYVRTFDGRRRFVQVAGTLTVELFFLPESVGATPSTPTPPTPAAPIAPPTSPPAPAPMALGAVTLSPTALREAYRSGLGGTCYAVSLPLPPGWPDQPGTLVIRARLDDALTGQSWRAERLRDVTPRHAPDTPDTPDHT